MHCLASALESGAAFWPRWERIWAVVLTGFCGDSESNSERLFEFLRQFEIFVLAAGSERLTRSACRKLQEIYHDILRVPALEAKRIQSIELDRQTKSMRFPAKWTSKGWTLFRC